MNRNIKISVIAIFLMSIIIVSCDDEDETTPVENARFTESELAILSQYLNLPAALFNYANLDLPPHYKSEEANIADNTPDNNPITSYGATLGRVLFYDKNLSSNNTISCASCHKQESGFSDTDKCSKGLEGQLTRRNSMTLINSRYFEDGRFFWDARANTLEEQTLMPIQDHIEMGMELSELENKLQELDYYGILFNKAFGDDQVTSDRVALALSQFIRSIVSYDSKFDRGFALAGYPEDEEEMPDFPNFTAQENLGLDIFYRGRKGATCLYCHGTPQHVNDEVKNNGLDFNYSDKGLGEITGNASDMAIFKVPSLRNIALTPPYMHDGRFQTLMEVVNHYSTDVQDHPNLNFRLKDTDDPSLNSNVLRLNLTQEEKEALVAFLHTLTDETIATKEEYSDPFN